MKTDITESVVKGINKGQELSFKKLYDSYYTYLCSYAVSYILDVKKAEEIVNDVFLNIWAKKETLYFPVHTYLQQSVKNGCLNHIRHLKSQQLFLDKYKEEIFNFQEEYCMSDSNPLSIIEIKELEKQITDVINALPEKCQLIFKKYLYEGCSTKEIAEQLGININTVRVQIKIAFDKIKQQLGPIAYIILFYLLKK